jgi:hypothetical protein
MKIDYSFSKFILFFVSIIVIGVLVFFLRPGPVALRPTAVSDISQLLFSLIVVSLFLERATEVFMTVWRGPDAKQKENTIRCYQAQLNELKKAQQDSPNRAEEMSKISANLNQATEEFIDYKSVTQRLSLWTGFISGLVVSLVGFRTLNTLVTPESYGLISGMQKNFFDLGDILITGGLIAGGSDGIHKILQVFLDWADATSGRIKTP